MQDLVDAIIQPHIPVPNQYSDYRDGKYFKKILIVMHNDHNEHIPLLIGLYSDDMEVANPLGTSKGEHKITSIYWTVLNVPQYFRSKICQIKLAVLAKREHINQHGLSVVMQPLLNDLKMLERDGLYVESLGCRMKCAFPFMSNDNLSAHWMANQFESFSPKIVHFCRTCMISYKRFIEEPETPANSYVWRTPEMRAHQEEQVRQNPANMQLYGIKGDSVLNNELKTFDITTGLPPDIPHDFLEG